MDFLVTLVGSRERLMSDWVQHLEGNRNHLFVPIEVLGSDVLGRRRIVDKEFYRTRPFVRGWVGSTSELVRLDDIVLEIDADQTGDENTQSH